MPEVPSFPNLPNLEELVKGATGAAKEATYLAVGLAVLGVHKAQEQRVAARDLLSKDPGIEARLGEIRAEVGRHAGEVDALVDGAIRRLEATVEPFEAQLPAPLREVTKLAHTGARQVRAKIAELLGAP